MGMMMESDKIHAANMAYNIEKAEKMLDSFKKENESKPGSDGKLIYDQPKCQICGKVLKAPSKSGVCSNKCQLKLTSIKVKQGVADFQEDADNLLGNINDAVNYINELLAIAQGIPAMLIDAAAYPGLEYSEYYTNRIQILELKIKKRINEVLIYKNKLLIKQLKASKNGLASDLDSLLGGVFTAIDALMKGLAAVVQAFDTAYTAVYNTIVNSLVPFLLKPEKMYFFATPRSFTRKPGKFVNEMTIINKNNSAVNALNDDLIEKLQDFGFPKIQDYEYCMDPKAFKVRQAFSDQNIKAIHELIGLMELLLYTGCDPLPKYSRLKISNPWYIIFLLTGWGPAGIDHFGIPLFP